MARWCDPIRRCARRAAVVVALCVPLSARAGAGDHIRLGQTTVVPSLATGFQFQSNPFRASSNATSGFDFTITPSLHTKADGPDLKFDLGADYTFQKYLQQHLTSLDRYSDFDIDASLYAFPKSMLGFKLDNRISLQSRNTDRPGASVAYNNRLRDAFAGTVPIKVGPVLSFEPGGAWNYDEYYIANFTSGGLRPFNFRNSYGPTLHGEWSFFPLTSVLLDFNYTWNHWNQNWVPTNNGSSALGSYIGLPNSQMWRLEAGIKGRLTSRLVLVGELGYGQAWYDEQSVVAAGGSATGVSVDLNDAKGILATVQLAWQTGPKEEIRVGYQRDFADSWFTNFLTYDEIFGGFNLRFGARIGVDALAKVRFENYFGAVTRNDLFVRVDGGTHYYLRDWASIDAKVSWDQRVSTDPGITFGNFGVLAGATFTY